MQIDARALNFIDVELANAQRTSVCALGIICVREGKTIFSERYLINPETTFDAQNIRIHGITPEMVKDKPKFPEIWAEIGPLFSNGIIVAHNAASMDINALCHMLERYGLPIPDFYYFCTCDFSRKHMPPKTCCSLTALCDQFEIPVQDHHDALCDAMACKDLFFALAEHFNISDLDIRRYCYQPTMAKKAVSRSQAARALNDLYGIAYGIGGDNVISEAEQKALCDWIDENRELDGIPEIHRCIHVIECSLEDNYISAVEFANILRLAAADQSGSHYTESTLAMQTLFGILRGIAADKEINEHELNSLLAWMTEHEYLRGIYPFDRVLEVVNEIMRDQIVTQQEQGELLKLFDRLTAPCALAEKPCATISFEGKVFCLSGDFVHGSKPFVAELIQARAGLIVGNVSKKVHYLVVGGSGSHDWKFGNFGTKVQKALQLQSANVGIQIIGEDMLFDALNNEAEVL